MTSQSPPPEELDETVEPEELLRRARSRLLEDLSGGNVKGGVIGTSGSATDENGVMVLPHSLSKYKEVSIYLLAVESHIFQCAAISHAYILYYKHIRCTTRMEESEFTPLQSVPLSFKSSPPRELEEFGIRRFDIIAVRI